jgi:anti-sigma regulatory factor (Ser/Thr protein kinase)
MKDLDKIRLSADIYSLPVLFEFVSHHARGLGLGRQRTGEVLRAVEEAITNILDHVYEDGFGDVALTCKEDSSGRLVIAISDFGEPFNMLCATEPGPGCKGRAAPAGSPSTEVMESMIDHIAYERREGSNVLIFTIEDV